MRKKNKNISLFSLMILTAFLISILYLANIKIVLILIIAAVPISVYSIYFGIRDHQNFFLEKIEKSEEKPTRIIKWDTPIRTSSPFHWTFPELISSLITILPTKTPASFILIRAGSTFEYFFDPEEKQIAQESIQISFEQPKCYENIILGNYAIAQLAESIT